MGNPTQTTTKYSLSNELQGLTFMSLYERKHRNHPISTIKKKINIKSFCDTFYHSVPLVCWGFLP